jgi:hypothetical protein
LEHDGDDPRQSPCECDTDSTVHGANEESSYPDLSQGHSGVTTDGQHDRPDASYVLLGFLSVARAAIDRHQLDELPRLCAKTGVPTETAKRQEFGDIPGWTLLLIFWGLIPFLVAAGFARRKVTVDLPASDDTLRQIRLVDLGSVAGLVLGIGLLVSALLTQESAWVWGGIAVALVTLVSGALARRMVWVTGRLDGDVLWIYGVHPAFAQEVEPLAPRNLGAIRSTNRWATLLLVVAVVALGVVLFLAFQLRT